MHSPLDNLDQLRLHELARQQAKALRREAISDFWRGADAALASTWGSACRSAQRLADRLARHAQGRKAEASQPASGDAACPR